MIFQPLAVNQVGSPGPHAAATMLDSQNSLRRAMIVCARHGGYDLQQNAQQSTSQNNVLHVV